MVEKTMQQMWRTVSANRAAQHSVRKLQSGKTIRTSGVNAELDEALKEIEERKKQPYTFLN